VKSEKIAPTDL